MNAQQTKSILRSPNPADYPELAGYTREQIYDETIGSGALYLAAQMARTMGLNHGDIVLDLGCGKSLQLKHGDRRQQILAALDRNEIPAVQIDFSRNPHLVL